MPNINPFQIRTARQEDAEKIVDLWCELMAFHEALDERFVRSKDSAAKFRTFLEINIDSSNAHVLVAISNGRLVGYTMAQEARRPPVFAMQVVVEIMDMAVSSASRRCGIGRALVNGTRDWAKQRGAEAIFLGVAATNPDALAFWANMDARPYIHLLELA
jgi:GNAT superfamily N-acetyltransferase